MGYYTTWTGEITIDPPIPWELLHDSKYHGEGYSNGTDAKIVTKEIWCKEIASLTRVGVAIQNRWQDSSTSYNMMENVQDIVDKFGEGRTFSGHIEAVGEEGGDLWRLRVRNGEAIRVEPTIMWPGDEFIVEEEYQEGDVIIDDKGNFYTFSEDGEDGNDWVGYGGEWSGPMSEIPQPVTRLYSITAEQWMEYQALKRMTR